ncbi:hypothetical protein BN59_02266 [Legionella massiliensis]|uniref:TIGR02444 family protein n=1 Tax=Legionella massiliensis TaxID=1034943 RepID=A0A078KU59_9GAMM|nr:TIGR02444 family protein [Legionella massiliensis]CDZ77970.1 hypothetical protein BN59_02266 [Legionella massiliensis]CEE13708.1 hypothetical protein BN1094_02266 [Legionella massiliensis]
MDNPFWQFSLRIYKNERVKNYCLEFQEQEAINVNLLLFCCWLAYAVEPISKAEFIKACQSIATWQKEVTESLRRARRYLKTFPAHSWPRDFYLLILENEIKSESYQQEQLYLHFADKQRKPSFCDHELMQSYLFWLFEEGEIVVSPELSSRIQDFKCLILSLLV